MKEHQALESLNGIARKVYDALPIGEAWTIGQVMTELRRIGSNPEQKIVMGCIANLADKKLVRADGVKFMRAGLVRAVRGKGIDAPAPEPAAEPPEPADPPEKIARKERASKVSPLERLANVAAQVRVMAANLGALAATIDDVAVEVEERLSGAETDAQKMRQLQALLKGMGS